MLLASAMLTVSMLLDALQGMTKIPMGEQGERGGLVQDKSSAGAKDRCLIMTTVNISVCLLP